MKKLFEECPELGTLEEEAFLADIGLDAHLEAIEEPPRRPFESWAS